mmetsp:Transcript_1255/g.3536  ORF Transcript_1255/g.3536 Transcript_1255/m.3536 type:complete len:628 (-) Transcript_1255:274-2157(-)
MRLSVAKVRSHAASGFAPNAARSGRAGVNLRRGPATRTSACVARVQASSFLGARVQAVASAAGARGRGARRQVTAMVFERFTERAIKAVMAAQNEARAMGRSEVTTDELLLGLIVEDGANRTANNRAGGFMNTGITIHKVRELVKSLRGSGNLGKGQPDIPFSVTAKEIFDLALDKSKELGHNFVAPEHITMALITAENSTINVVIRKLGVEPNTIKDEALKQLQGQQASEGWKKPVAQGGRGQGQGQGQQQKSVLEEFCRDLCAEAQEGILDLVIGRDTEIMRVMQILARRRKNNPILLGEPGVGKTAIAEGLAQCIVNNVGMCGEELPDFLKDKKIMSLDVGLLMAGAKERGELENRVTKLIQEITDSGNVILLVDEVHTLVGAGSVGRGGGGGGGAVLLLLLLLLGGRVGLTRRLALPPLVPFGVGTTEDGHGGRVGLLGQSLLVLLLPELVELILRGLVHVFLLLLVRALLQKLRPLRIQLRLALSILPPVNRRHVLARLRGHRHWAPAALLRDEWDRSKGHHVLGPAQELPKVHLHSLRERLQRQGIQVQAKALDRLRGQAFLHGHREHALPALDVQVEGVRGRRRRGLRHGARRAPGLPLGFRRRLGAGLTLRPVTRTCCL